jgi:flagellar basal-body rod protein FlgB
MLVHSILDVCRGLTMAARFGGSGMDMLTSNSALLLEKSVGFLWTKQAAILDNIANAETPNYKTKVVTFEESIRSRLEQAAASPGEAEESVRDILEDPEVTVFEAQEQTRMDDNGVNTTEQMVELIRNAYQQQYVYQAINKHYAILRMAVKGQ